MFRNDFSTLQQSGTNQKGDNSPSQGKWLETQKAKFPLNSSQRGVIISANRVLHSKTIRRTSLRISALSYQARQKTDYLQLGYIQHSTTAIGTLSETSGIKSFNMERHQTKPTVDTTSTLLTNNRCPVNTPPKTGSPVLTSSFSCL